MKTIKALVFILFAIALVAAAFFVFYCQKVPVAQAPASDDNTCQTDADCVLANGMIPGEPCCWNCGYIAVNKDNFTEKESWEKANCSVGIQRKCPKKCKAALPDHYKAVCRSNKCELIENSEASTDGGNISGKANMANPASVYCEQQGGKAEIRNGDAGQQGICIMPDGVECDEWDFFRTKQCNGLNNQ